MLKDLKQLFLDLQDKSAGVKISQLPVKIPLWLYTKYYIVLSIIIILSIIYTLVYYVPQIPKFVSEFIPEATVTIRQNTLEIDPSTPLKLTSPEGSFIIDTRLEPDDYSNYPTGFFLYRNRSVVKDANGVTQEFIFKNLSDFSLTKDQLINWFTENKSKIILILIPLVILITILISTIVWAVRLIGFYLFSALLFLFFKISKRPLEYYQILPVVIYASVLPLLISYVLFFAPHPLLNLLNFVLFLFFTLSWLLPLTSQDSDTQKKLLNSKK